MKGVLSSSRRKKNRFWDAVSENTTINQVFLAFMPLFRYNNRICADILPISVFGSARDGISFGGLYL